MIQAAEVGGWRGVLLIAQTHVVAELLVLSGPVMSDTALHVSSPFGQQLLLVILSSFLPLAP